MPGHPCAQVRERDGRVAERAEVLLQRQAAELRQRGQRAPKPRTAGIEHEVLDARRDQLLGQLGQAGQRVGPNDQRRLRGLGQRRHRLPIVGVAAHRRGDAPPGQRPGSHDRRILAHEDQRQRGAPRTAATPRELGRHRPTRFNSEAVQAEGHADVVDLVVRHLPSPAQCLGRGQGVITRTNRPVGCRKSSRGGRARSRCRP
jgi:hypothetical protein